MWRSAALLLTTGSAAAAGVVGAGHSDPVTSVNLAAIFPGPTVQYLIAIGLGILFGIGLRRAELVIGQRALGEVGRELAVSLLIAGMNFSVAAFLVSLFTLSLLGALLVSGCVSSLGVRSLKAVMGWAWQRLFGTTMPAEPTGEQRQAEQRELSSQRWLAQDPRSRLADPKPTALPPPEEDTP